MVQKDIHQTTHEHAPRGTCAPFLVGLWKHSRVKKEGLRKPAHWPSRRLPWSGMGLVWTKCLNTRFTHHLISFLASSNKYTPLQWHSHHASANKQPLELCTCVHTSAAVNLMELVQIYKLYWHLLTIDSIVEISTTFDCEDNNDQRIQELKCTILRYLTR